MAQFMLQIIVWQTKNIWINAIYFYYSKICKTINLKDNMMQNGLFRSLTLLFFYISNKFSFASQIMLRKKSWFVNILNKLKNFLFFMTKWDRPGSFNQVYYFIFQHHFSRCHNFRYWQISELEWTAGNQKKKEFGHSRRHIIKDGKPKTGKLERKRSMHIKW